MAEVDMGILKVVISLGLVAVPMCGLVLALRARERVLITTAALCLIAAGIVSFLALHVASAAVAAGRGSETLPASDGIADEQE